MVDCVCFNPAERRQAGRWYAIGDRTLQKEALCFHLGRDSWGVYGVFGKRPLVSRLFIFGCRGLMSERGGGGANMTDRACQRLNGDVHLVVWPRMHNGWLVWEFRGPCRSWLSGGVGCVVVIDGDNYASMGKNKLIRDLGK